MGIEQSLLERSLSSCELCGANKPTNVFMVPPSNKEDLESCILVCNQCDEQLLDESKMVASHWRCLQDSMWSTVAPVQIMAYRVLDYLKAETWAQDLFNQIYLDDETMARAQAHSLFPATGDKHRDSNANELVSGDSVTLIKDLDVKGANFNAKRGTMVKNIRLVEDNIDQIEGKVEGQQIVILTKFVRKA